MDKLNDFDQNPATSGSSIKSQVLDLKTLPIFSPLKRGVIGLSIRSMVFIDCRGTHGLDIICVYTNLINPRNLATSCWCIMAHIPKTEIKNLIEKNFGNISSIYLVTKALQILSCIHSTFYESQKSKV